VSSHTLFRPLIAATEARRRGPRVGLTRSRCDGGGPLLMRGSLTGQSSGLGAEAFPPAPTSARRSVGRLGEELL
jgi:hypothetical protein